MNTGGGFYEDITQRLRTGSSRAILGLRGFRSSPLREYLRAAFEQAPGEQNSLLADPVFEATFGWSQANETMSDLSGKLLHAQVVKALSKPVLEDMSDDYTFPESRQPYVHQIQAWRALSDRDAPQSILVSSGTGSGKTECFLVPILNDLAEELTAKQDGGQSGVRAVFLYPLNALIKSQKERLQAWSEPFGGTVRFSLYNGDTPEQAKSKWRCEVPDRRTLRAQPPQILVTNPTMLEYMLVRAEDRPILDQSQGKLRWIVIDEAHTYLGSQAAELTLLLRRTMHAFGCSPGQVHIVATSATLGDASEAARQRLQQFLSDLASVPENQVTVISGSRIHPSAIDHSRQGNPEVYDLDEWRTLDPQALYKVITQEQPLVGMRDALVEKPHTLTQLAEVLFRRSDSEARHRTLQIIDLCTGARNQNNEPFLPLRGHIFHRTLPGLWACANENCIQKAGTALDDPEWPFGGVYFERREVCHCGSPVFDLVQCTDCGAEYLTADEVVESERDALRQRSELGIEDEFQEQLEPLEGGLIEETEPTEPVDIAGQQRLLARVEDATQIEIGLTEDGTLDWSGENGVSINLCSPEKEGLVCPVCRESKHARQLVEQFRPFRVGAPFLLTSTTPTLLGALPRWGNVHTARPLDGRRLVTFTDSRQGTARTVVKAQQQVERDYVGSLIYHHLAASASAADPSEITAKENQVEALRSVATTSSTLKSMLESAERELGSMRMPSFGELNWHEVAAKLHSAEDFKRWLKPALSELTYGQLADESLVDLCLYREFFLRPSRQYSLEGLGLVQLHYHGLDKAELPRALEQKGLAQKEWLNLLRLAVDTFIRSGSPSVEIPEPIQRWLGYPGRPSILLAPDSGQKTQPSQRYWPSTTAPNARRNRLIRLIMVALDLDLSRETDALLVDEILRAMWGTLVNARLLTPVEGGFQLSLKQSASLRSVSEAWFCPVTRRLLPVAFKGVTPYLPTPPVKNELKNCRKVEMPQPPYPFWEGVEGQAADDWLASSERIQALRSIGAWPDISDRIARFSRYYRAAEHSAQLSGTELTRREREFKEGKINLLSCSTTMEMGVDIGGLSAVAMNNVPPHPANFLQRAGRAGRRGETHSLSFTLCKATPHGEAVFRNPLWAFTTQLATPKVDLRSTPIVQRHINALLLATFLAEIASESAHRLKTGWFFEAAEDSTSAPVDRFMEWCLNAALKVESLRKGIDWLIRSSVLEGVPRNELVATSVQHINDVAAGWRLELDGLLAQQTALKTRDGQSKPEVAIRLRLERCRREYLLGLLASRAFLPGYGFPTGVVPFVTITRDELDRIKRDKEGREDNRQRRAGFPTRDLPVAIRDYAPGTDTVLGGRVYRSAGVTLNWQLPVEAEGAPEIQDLRWVWRCNSCGGNGTRLSYPESCPSCGSLGPNTLTVSQFLQPAGFAVDFRWRPHNDITIQQYLPVKEPLISMAQAEWMILPGANLVRYRTTPAAQLFHYSDGLYGNGYSLCLRCGRTDSMTHNGGRPENLRGHKRLQGGKLNDSERMCPGNDESWAIVDKLRLGATYNTEVFELQLRDINGNPIREKTTSYTLAIALRRAFCTLIGIEESEIGATAAETRDQDGFATYSAYLFDTASGGAGYSGQLSGFLPELIRRVKNQVLQCPNDCDSACQACLLTYDTQHHIHELDRHAVLQLLTSDFVDSFALSKDLMAFGEETALELEPLTLAIDREWQRWKFENIRIYLSGASETWEPLEWRLLGEARRLRESGVEITLICDESSLNGLAQSQKDELFVLVTELGAKIQTLNGFRRVLGHKTMLPALEVASPTSTLRWATTNAEAITPNSRWGSGDSGGRFVRSPRTSGGLQEIPGVDDLGLEMLRPQPSAGVAEIKIHHELDGPVRNFGSGVWSCVCESVPALKALLQGSQPITHLSYSDRYLRSPLTLLLLERILVGLQQYPGGSSEETEVFVTTAELGRAHSSQPRLWSHDWQDEQDREKVAQNLLSQNYRQSRFLVLNSREVPHARFLTLHWQDGHECEIRLDQGVGYWRACGNRIDFPFTAPHDRQLHAFEWPKFAVEAASSRFETCWYCVHES